jgi:hypothetical protein
MGAKKVPSSASWSLLITTGIKSHRIFALRTVDLTSCGDRMRICHSSVSLLQYRWGAASSCLPSRCVAAAVCSEHLIQGQCQVLRLKIPFFSEKNPGISVMQPARRKSINHRVRAPFALGHQGLSSISNMMPKSASIESFQRLQPKPKCPALLRLDH